MTGRYKAYPEYKYSAVEWLGKVPSHWEIAKTVWHFLAEKGKNGQALTNEYIGQNEGNYPVYSGQTGNNGVMGCINTYEFDTGKEGVLFSTTVGAKAMTLSHLKGKFSLSQNCLIIKNISPVSDTRFYFYHFQPLFSFERGLIPEHMQASFRMEDLYQYKIALPSVAEQQKIAAFLDHETAKIDTLIAKQEKLIELLKEKRQAVISHAVTKGLNPDAPMKDSGVEWLGQVPAHWVVSKFGYISQVVRGGSPRPAGDPTLFNGDYSPWVTVAEITKDDEIYLTETETFLTKKGSLQCRVFTAGTLLLSNSGATLGVPSILNINANANDGVVGFEKLKINSEFAYFYLSSLTQGLRERIKQGSGQPNLNIDIVKDISIPLPPSHEVEQIVIYIHKLRSHYGQLQIKASQGIMLLQERRSALISAAVTGKIDVRDFVVPPASQEEQA